MSLCALTFLNVTVLPRFIHLRGSVSRRSKLAMARTRMTSRGWHACSESYKNWNEAKLISAKHLDAWLDSDDYDRITVLDVRGRVVKKGGRVERGFQEVEYVCDDNDYFGGHIPSAKFVDWRRIDVVDHMGFCDDMSQLGVERLDPIVVYDWGDMLFASRLWFALVTMGCEQVYMLNGGWTAWDRYEGAVSLETACPLKTYSELESKLGHDERPKASVSLEQMRDVVEGDRGEVIVVDARSARQFDGRERRSRRAGHIPGAINVAYATMLREDKVGLLPDDEMIKALREKVEVGKFEYVTYCNGGVASSLLLFCLVRCGVPLHRVRNYCNSFNEWGNLADTPLSVPMV